MKKLNKILINPERVMKNKELIALRGGVNCWCWNGSPPGTGGVCITGVASDAEECQDLCYGNNCASFTFGG